MLPEWLNEKQEYIPVKDSSIFIDRTLLNISSSLKRFDYKTLTSRKINPAIFLLFIFITILTISLSNNLLYVYLVLSLLVIRLALYKVEVIANVLNKSIKALIVSIIILIPSLFMGYISTFININIKVFISTTLIALFNSIYTTSDICSAFRNYKISNLFIYIIDMTIKYIVIFSKASEELLYSLKCRTIGKINKKESTVTNIVGSVFIKGKHESKEMLDAMKCRGFVGEYPKYKANSLTIYDYLFIVLTILEVIVFEVL